MKKLSIAMVLLMCAGVASAQMSVVKQAKSQKANPEAAAKAILPALENAETANNPDVWQMAGDFQKAIYEAENMKAYLPNSKADTEKMNASLLQMFNYYLTCDDKEAQMMKENPKYKKFKYRKKNMELMLKVRPNLLNGGSDAFNKQDYKAALDYFSIYVDMVDKPMFQGTTAFQGDTLRTLCAAYASMAGQLLENNDVVLKYGKIGKDDPNEGWRSLMYLSEYYKAQKDNAELLNVLQEGVERFPEQDYFVGNLMDQLLNSNQLEKGEQIIDQLLAKKETPYYLYVKGALVYEKKDYAECEKYMDKIIAMNDILLAEAWSKKGDCYLFPAQAIVQENTELKLDDPKYNENEEKIKAEYRKAMPFYEKARELAPDNTPLWKYLVNIYWVLNDSKYEEVAKILGLE